MTIDYGRDLAFAIGPVTLGFPDGDTRTIVEADVDFAAEATDRANLTQALMRRLLTPRGQLIDDPNYGYALEDWQNEDVDPSGRELGRVAADVDAELRKDERVRSSSTLATFKDDALTLVTTIVDQRGPFRMVTRVDDVGVKFLEAA